MNTCKSLLIARMMNRVTVNTWQQSTGKISCPPACRLSKHHGLWPKTPSRLICFTFSAHLNAWFCRIQAIQAVDKFTSARGGRSRTAGAILYRVASLSAFPKQQKASPPDASYATGLLHPCKLLSIRLACTPVGLGTTYHLPDSPWTPITFLTSMNTYHLPDSPWTPVTCLLSPVPQCQSPITCPLSPVPCHQSPATFLMSDIPTCRIRYSLSSSWHLNCARKRPFSSSLSLYILSSFTAMPWTHGDAAEV